MNNFLSLLVFIDLSIVICGTSNPTGIPTGIPSGSPSGMPTSSAPTGSPSSAPTGSPSIGIPTYFPTTTPTTIPVGCVITSITCETELSCGGVSCDADGIPIKLTLNAYSGTFPSLVNSLKYLSITDSTFDPPTIPTSLSTLQNLQTLILSNDNLIGTLPTFLSDLSALSDLTLSGNKLTGTVPASLGYTAATSGRKLGTTASLVRLDLANNVLYGSIPSSLCDEGLTYLNVSSNTNLTCYASCLSTVASHNFGSLFPCTETPTTQPSSQPSSLPTASPTVLTDCIQYLLFDSFGDGWSTAKLSVYSSTGSYETYSVGCGEGELVEKFCFNPSINNDGDFVVIGVTGYKPKNPWEIVWQSYNTFDGKTYTGSYHTTMTFIYSKSSSGSTSIILASIEDEVKNDKSCQSCVDYSPKIEKKQPAAAVTNPSTTQKTSTKTSPKKSSPSSTTSKTSTTTTTTPATTAPKTTTTRPTKKSPAASTTTGNGKASSQQQQGSSSSSSNLKQVAGPSSNTVYIAPNSGVKRSLWRSSYDLDYELSGSWYSKDESETDFYVIDSSGSLAYSGTYCGLKGGECQMKLEDGSYTWRVSGASNPYSSSVSWNFCGMSGVYSNELQFTVSGGKCFPDDVYDIAAYCAAHASDLSEDDSTTAKSEVLLEGTIELRGVTSQELSRHENAVLQEAVIQEIKDARFADVHEDSVVVTTTAIPSVDSSATTSHRTLTSSVVHKIAFSMKLTSAVMTPDEESIHGVKEYLTRAMSSSLFVARIVSHARAKHLDGLSTITSASMLSLDVTHTTRENIIESAVSSITVIVSAAIGLVFGTLLAFYLFKSMRTSTKSQLVNANIHSNDVTFVDFKESVGGESTSFLPQNIHNANLSGGDRII